MKRSWLLILSFLFALTACGQATTTSTATATAAAVYTATPVPTATPAPTLQPGDSQRTLMVDSLERSYLLHIPPGLDSQQPVPVVLAFHGYTENAVFMQQYTGFNDTADKNSFIIVYPNGTGVNNYLAWNASGCCGEAVNKNTDDIAFVRQLLADLGSIITIDPKRIYAAGFSNGAVFAYRLACEMSDTFAAIAPVDSPMLTNPCQPQQPVSVVQVYEIIGDDTGETVSKADIGTNSDIVLPPVKQVIDTWVQLDGCIGTAQVEKQGLITHTVYSSCRAGTAVELYIIAGNFHAWPNQFAFPTCSNQMMWDFFAAHPKP